MHSTYVIVIPYRQIEHLFGVAYPSLELVNFRRVHIVERYLSSKISSQYAAKIRIELDVSKSTSTKWYIEIRGDAKLAYMAAIDIEKSLSIRPNWLGVFIMKKFNRIFRRTPKEFFRVESDNIAEAINWLQKNNVTYYNYQISNKFRNATVLSFRRSEDSVLYKLTFGDE